MANFPVNITSIEYDGDYWRAKLVGPMSKCAERAYELFSLIMLDSYESWSFQKVTWTPHPIHNITGCFEVLVKGK